MRSSHMHRGVSVNKFLSSLSVGFLQVISGPSSSASVVACTMCTIICSLIACFFGFFYLWILGITPTTSGEADLWVRVSLFIMYKADPDAVYVLEESTVWKSWKTLVARSFAHIGCTILMARVVRI